MAEVTMLAAVTLALVFGAGDQYLGSLSAHPWGADVSLLSAPWLLLAFLAGYAAREPKRAAVLGLACTASAFVGYGLMTLSPAENAHLTLQSASGFLRSERLVTLGGCVTGPIFGWLGNRWYNDRVWPGAAAVAGALCLEPFARLAAAPSIPLLGYVTEIRFRAVFAAEVAVGLAMLIYVALQARAPSTRTRVVRR